MFGRTSDNDETSTLEGHHEAQTGAGAEDGANIEIEVEPEVELEAESEAEPEAEPESEAEAEAEIDTGASQNRTLHLPAADQWPTQIVTAGSDAGIVVEPDDPPPA